MVGLAGTRGDRVALGHLDQEAQWDLRDLLDSLEHLDCLEEKEVLVIQVSMVRLEYLVDTLVSTSPSNLSFN